MDSLLPVSSLDSPPKLGTHRWLLGQLSSYLKHHLSYTCVVKKYSLPTGKRVECTFTCPFFVKGQFCTPHRADYVQVCNNINQKIHELIHTNRANLTLDIDQLIQNIDPVIWDTICILTQTLSEKNRKSEAEPNIIKNTRRLFILHQMMFCIDNRCSMPFHMVNADLIDSCGGSGELVRMFNRLGVRVSFDTLSRHIQSTVEEISLKGLLQGLNPHILTIFTMDNLDYLLSFAQVFCGNQHLSWHGATVQAVQTKPSLSFSPTQSSVVRTACTNRRRAHALLSPMNSPDSQNCSPVPKSSRAVTGTESQQEKETPLVSQSYDSHNASLTL